ncbi:hypothetical protein ACSBR2_039720 [Camellia fascicularis]
MEPEPEPEPKPKPKPNRGKDYWIVEHIPRVNLWSRIGKEKSITQICTLQQYFNRKVENARVGEDKNELNVNSINFQVCAQLNCRF